MNPALHTRIEAYLWLHAETLRIPLDTLEWADEGAPVPGTAVHAASPVYTLRVVIGGRPQVLIFTAEECPAGGLSEDHGAEAWPRLTEKIDGFLGALAPKKSPRLGY